MTQKPPPGSYLTLYFVNKQFITYPFFLLIRASLVAQLVKKKSACNTGDLGLIPAGEDPLEKEKATHSSILA